MPIYEYKCRYCEHSFEKLQKIADAPVRNCPACGKEGAEKMITAPQFRLAGDGWYETDFKKNNQKNLKKKDDSKS